MRSVLLRWLPAPVLSLARRMYYRPTVRKLLFLPADVFDQMTGARGDRDVPPRSIAFVGDGDFEAIGLEFLGYFQKLCGLKPGERVLDVGCGAGRIREGTSATRFEHELPGCRVVDAGVPESAVAYREEDVRRIYAAAGLRIEEPIRWGGWSGRPDHLSSQDIVIAARR